jgi:hypothetical protein
MKKKGYIHWTITKEMAENELRRPISDSEFNSFCNEFNETYQAQFELTLAAHASLWEKPIDIELSRKKISDEDSIQTLLDGVIKYFKQDPPREETREELELLTDWVLYGNMDTFYRYYEIKKGLDDEWLNNQYRQNEF